MDLLHIIFNTMKCKSCGQEHPSTMKFCPETGEKLEHERVCSKCGNKNIPQNAKFCSECGNEIDSHKAEQATVKPEQKMAAETVPGKTESKAKKITPLKVFIALISLILGVGIILGKDETVIIACVILAYIMFAVLWFLRKKKIIDL